MRQAIAADCSCHRNGTRTLGSRPRCRTPFFSAPIRPDLIDVLWSGWQIVESVLKGLEPNDGKSGVGAGHQMNDERDLHEKARQVIRAGTLPSRRPDRIWGGPGGGANCAICNSPVERHQLEFEAEFAGNGDDAGLNKYHVHVACFAAWEHHLQQRDASDNGAVVSTPREASS
jgi:hypothetical protein